MTNRPTDITLPDGWTWERVEASRAKWDIADDMVPIATAPGVVAWGTINSVRLERGRRGYAAITLDDGRVFPSCNGEALSWSIGLYMTHNESLAGYPKARAVIAAMREHRPDQLARERRDMLKGSLDRVFGHNARRCLNLIDGA